MADEKSGSTLTDMLQSRAGLAAIIVALASLLMIKPSPLNSARPSVEPSGSKSYGAPQDVDARLWQDPFQAVNDATKGAATDRFEIKEFDGKKFTIELTDSKQDIHSPENVFNGLPDRIEGDQITLMAVMMSASSTPEEHEMRLRRRYALVSALATKKYTPVDAEHLGYFKTNELRNEHDLPGIVPFEWFEKQPRIKAVEDSKAALAKPPRRLLVLWVDDTRFDRMPLKKTIKLFSQFEQAISTSKVTNKDRITRIVLGPSSSGNLREMAMEVKDWDGRGCDTKDKETKEICSVRFYSSQATSADSEILRDLAPGGKMSLSEYFRSKDIHLVRTIADDKTVIDTLVQELKIRHVKDDQEESGDNDTGNEAPENHIVLLSDWDTFYGRALPRAFESNYENEDENKVKCSSLDLKEHVHCFKYVRGIDGILPGAPSNNVKEPSRQTKTESGSTSEVSDQPEGMSQKDYLRRIVEEIRKLDQRLHKDKSCFSRCGVTSIGVLGYDVYDKLIILRALRPYFPNKIFFTTDLTASYWSPSEMPYTHNLIVSSGFGLTLNPALQKDIPPFRDSYQTAFFLSVLLALDKNGTEKIPGVDKPRIFEIGRNGPIDLSDPEETREPDPAKHCARHVSDCSSIHPASIFDQSQADGKTWIKFILAACSFVLLYLASWNVRRWVNHIFLKNETDIHPADPAKFAHKFHWKRVGVILCFLLAVLLVWWIVNEGASNKEPWLWLEGISIWPSELLRFVALIASLVLLHDVFQRIGKSDEEIAAAFGLRGREKKEQTTPGLAATLSYALSFWQNCSSVLKWQSTKKERTWLSKATLNGLEGQVINVNQLWKSYLEMGERKRRVCRTLIGMAPFLIFAWSSIILSGGMSAPARGDFAYYADKVITGPVVLLMLFLAMLVIDASRLCAAFISHLDETQSDWLTGTKNPSCTMIHLSNQWGLKPAHAAYWLDAQLVAQRTEVIQRLIWYPVIPVFLLAIARSPVFDDWSHPTGLIATLGILILYLISCAFLLEYGAKKMRLKASKKIGEELRKLRGSFGSGNNPKIERLENLIKEIETLKQGAFLPLFQQPWVGAVLAMASGAGGLAWMGTLLGTP